MFDMVISHAINIDAIVDLIPCFSKHVLGEVAEDVVVSRHQLQRKTFFRSFIINLGCYIFDEFHAVHAYIKWLHKDLSPVVICQIKL